MIINILIVISALMIGVISSVLSLNWLIPILIIAFFTLFITFKNPQILIFGIILSVYNLFHLIPSKLGEIGIIFYYCLIIIFIIWLLLTGRIKSKNLSQMNFNRSIFAYLVLVLISIFNSFYLYDQPIFMGIKASKWYLIIIAYFLISYLLINNNIQTKKLENIIMYIGFTAALIYITQYILYDKIQFLHLNFLERFDKVRFYQGVHIVILSLFICFYKIITSSRKINLFLLTIFLVDFYYILVVANSRTFTIPVLIALFVVSLIQRKRNRYFVISFSVLFILYILSKEENLIKNLMLLLIEDVSSGGGTFGFRLSEIKFYLSEVSNSPLIGRGVLFESHYSSYIALGKQYNYYLSDVGLIGIYFKFGIAGLFIIICIVFQFIKTLTILWINNNYRYDFLGYLIFVLISMWLVPIFDNTSSLICLILVLSLIDSEIKKINIA